MLDRCASTRGLLGLLGLVTLASVIGVACSSFTVTSTAANDDAGAGDAAVSAGDGATVDAIDAAPHLDASGCTDTFCTGFDEMTPLRLWDAPLESNKATVTIDGTASASPPSSLLLETSAKASSTDAAMAALRKDFGIHQGLRCAFDVRMDMLGGAASGAQILAIQIADSAGYFQVIVDLFGDGRLEVSTQNSRAEPGMSFTTPGSVISAGAWRRLALDVSFVNEMLPATATLELDGTVLDTLPIAPMIASGSVSVQLGLNNVAHGDEPWQMRVDDVGCTPR